MRLKIQVGDSKVDVGGTIEKGLKQLDRIRRDRIKGLKRFRSRHAETEQGVIAGLNRVMESLGYRLVPKEGGATATPPSSQSTKPRAQLKAKAKRRS